MANDKLIRELLINVKQQGGTKVTKVVQQLSNDLEDAAAGAEITNEQLNKLPKTLLSIEKAADRATKSLSKVTINRNMSNITTVLSQISNKMDDLTLAVMEVSDATRAGFDDMVRSSKSMGNQVSRSIEKVEDSVSGLNRTALKSSAGMGGISSEANKASRALGDTSGSARGATRDFAAMAKIGGGLPILYAAIASNIFVLKSAFDQLKMGDQLNRLEQFGTLVGSQTGTPVQSLAISLQESVGYAVSFQEAMKQASTAAAYGFDTKQLESFGLVARRAAAVLGVDMTDALNRVIKGVSKQEIELLDELGVTIRLNDAYAAYVNQLNAANTGIKYTVNSLSTFQKQQAYANAVIAESTKRFGYLDQALRATSWETFGANADSMMRRLQQSASKFLEPTIASLNAFIAQSRAAGKAEAGIAQQQSNRVIDPKNTGSVILGLASSDEGYMDALGSYKEALEKRNKLKQQYDEAYNKASFLGKAAITQVAEGTPVAWSAAGFTSDENKANIESIVKLKLGYEALDKEIKDADDNLKAWNTSVEVAGGKATEASKQFQDTIKLSKNSEDMGAGISFDSTALAGIAELQKSYDQTKKNASDLATDIQNVGSNTAVAAKTASTLNQTMVNIEALSKSTGQNMDDLARNLNIGVSSMSGLKAQAAAISTYANLAMKDSSNKLDVEKKIDEVYNSTRSKAKAEEAGRALEMQQLKEKENALKGILSTNEGNKALEKEITEVQYEQLKIKNQGMEADKKVKDKRDKTLGVEQQIALLNNRTMTEQQFKVAQLNTELSIEEKKLAFYSKQKDKLAEHEQTRQKIAQLERERWENTKALQNTTTEGQEKALQNAQKEAGRTGQASNMQEMLTFYEARKAQLKGNAEAQQTLNEKIKETSITLKELAISREREMQSTVASSVGASYTPTTGLDGSDKAFADMQNRMSAYDQSISKLSELNSEATAVGQSMGNVANAMIQFSQGSLDTTSAISTGIQTVASMMSYSSGQQVSAIDAAIAAEQKRDGKSEASKARLAKLEADKIKIQQDSAKKQIIIQTALAVMQAANAVPYPWSIPLMIAAGVSGALAYSQASTASSMSGIADSSTTSSLTIGERQKNVDVSMNANSGEQSYIRGDKGIGGANSFVPRAEGGNMYPGVSYATGEHGVEVITPKVPMKATPAEEVGTSPSPAIGQIVMNVHTMDSSSFRDFLINNNASVRDSLEAALNERGTSLNKLNR